MNESELITLLAENSTIDEQDIKCMLSAFSTVVSERLEAYDVVNLSSLGCFEVEKHEQYVSVQSLDHKQFLVPPRFNPVFKSYLADISAIEKEKNL